MKIGHLYVYSVTKVYDSLPPIIDLCGENTPILRKNAANTE